MIRIGRAAWPFALALLAFATAPVRSDEKPKPDPGAVDRVLEEWQRKASTITSVEVRFSQKTQSGPWPETRREGFAQLAPPNLAMLEWSSVDAEGKAVELKERLIWNGRSILQFDLADRTAFRFPLRQEWPAPPGPLCLPFFFRMTVEGAKRDYDWAVLRDGPDQIILKATPKKPGPLDTTESNFLFLDRKTFLPQRLIVKDRDGRRETYEALEIKLNAVAGLEDLQAPCLDAWTVEERDGWLVRLFLK